jgi:hypothetical protein
MSNAILIGALCLSLLPAGLAEAGQIVPYERSEESGDASLTDLFKKTYDEQELETTSSLANNRWNAFRNLQNALTEMMVDPAESAKNRQEFQANRQVWDDYNVNPEGYGYKYMYWNRGDGVEAKVPLADGTGKVARTTVFAKEIGMEGKNLYMPDKAALDKIMEIQNAQMELAKKYGIDLQKPSPEVAEQYNAEAQRLEMKFLEAVAAEIPKLKEAAKNQKVYALGFKYDEQDNMAPLELNVAMIESAMRRLGVSIPDGKEPPKEGAEGPAAQTAAPTEPTIRVRQSAQTVQEMNREYEVLTTPFSDETARTKAELENDMFRVRTRASDMQPGVKTYDLLLSPEYATGALNLPSKLPQDQ